MDSVSRIELAVGGAVAGPDVGGLAAGEEGNWERSVAALAERGLGDRIRAGNLKLITHVHNKGVIVDRRTVVISSTNWSDNSIERAREAGVAIESPELAVVRHARSAYPDA